MSLLLLSSSDETPDIFDDDDDDFIPAPVFTVAIATVERPALIYSASITATANGQDTAHLTVPSYDGSYRPSLDEEIVVDFEDARNFGGIITGVIEHGLAHNPSEGIHNEIEATDFNRLAVERYANEDFPEQTLKARLTTLVANYLTASGVLLHSSQADGPTLGASTYRYVRIDDILNETASLAEGWIWSISYNKVLRMYEPGTLSAPFNITTPVVSHNWYGDLTVEPTRDNYANRVIVDTGSLAGIAEDTGQQTAIGRVIEIVLTSPDTTTQEQADALAVAYLSQHSVTLKRVTYQTRTAGLIKGMTQTINVPERNINNVFLITDISTVFDGSAWHRTVTAIEGLVYLAGWRETFKQWSSGGRLGAVGGTSVGSSSARRFAYYLGPSGLEFVQSVTPDWVPASAIQVEIDTVPRGTTTATITARLKALSAGVTVQARLFDVTDNVACAGESATVTNTDWELVTWSVTLTAGSHLYRLELLPGTANEDVGAAGAYLL